jgi:hypothetical protein
MKKIAIFILLSFISCSVMVACNDNKSGNEEQMHEITKLHDEIKTLEKQVSDVMEEKEKLLEELNEKVAELTDVQDKVEIFKHYAEYSRYRVLTENFIYYASYQPRDMMFTVARARIGDKSFKQLFDRENIQQFAVSKNDELIAMTYCNNEGKIASLEILDLKGNIISAFESSHFEPTENPKQLGSSPNINLRGFSSNNSYLVGTMADKISVGYFWVIELSTNKVELFFDGNEFNNRLEEIGYLYE